MSNNYQKLISIFLYILLALGLIFGVIFYIGDVVPGTEGTSVEEPLITEKFLLLSYIYFAIAAILALVFPIFYMITHPAKVKNVLISLLVFAIVLVLGYLLGSDQQLASSPDISGTTLKLVDSGLKAAYIFLGLAIIGVLFSELSSIFR
ncbi:MAG: hypothetical protein JXB00_07410 [Bacteroidales bacterium]|nr:hypothetical protein [Bacteroidales bacterium]